MMRMACIGCVLLGLLCPGLQAQELWQQIKGKHFVVFYQSREDKETAEGVLRRAEEYYDRIGSQIGYKRYADFWTWEERVKIFLFPNREKFVQYTGMPSWSLGYAARDSRLFKSRTIVTYPRENNFIDGLLPHEISHLIFSDFIPDQARLPIWFIEGFAQLQESGKNESARRMMQAFISQGQYIRLDFLMNWDIRQEQDPLKVEVFYAQSLSLVEFLIKKYGRHSFERLCRELRDGKSFKEALSGVYTNQIKSLPDLEQQWIKFTGR